MKNDNIPKIIHYCWFGDKQIDKNSKKFINEWKHKLPEYKFILWNEENSNLQSNDFVKKAYESKQWSFVSDYVRMDVLYKYGGIYLDTDVQIIKAFDENLLEQSFIGFESKDCLGTGTIGVKPKNKIIKKMLNYYNSDDMYDINGNIKTIPNTHIITDIAVQNGLKLNGMMQVINDDMKIYPIEYFSAKDCITRDIIATKDTYCIHHYNGSWFDETQKKSMRKVLKNIIMKIIGRERYFKFRYIIATNLRKNN